jgi:hypothetical protein
MDLTSLHALLDVTESVILETFQSSDSKQDQRDRERFLDSLYRPTKAAQEINGDGYQPIPAGFDDGGEDAFDLAMKSGAKG